MREFTTFLQRHMHPKYDRIASQNAGFAIFCHKNGLVHRFAGLRFGLQSYDMQKWIYDIGAVAVFYLVSSVRTLHYPAAWILV